MNLDVFSVSTEHKYRTAVVAFDPPLPANVDGATGCPIESHGLQISSCSYA